MTRISATPSPESRCRYRTPGGRRCRDEAHNLRLGLCRKHSTSQNSPQPSADFLRRLTTDCDDFTTALSIHNSLSGLYKLLAADLITARRAAVLAYIANLLLRAIPIVHSELNGNSSEEPVKIEVDFGDLPRPNRDFPPGAANQGTFSPSSAYPSATAPGVSVRVEEVCS